MYRVNWNLKSKKLAKHLEVIEKLPIFAAKEQDFIG